MSQDLDRREQILERRARRLARVQEDQQRVENHRDVAIVRIGDREIGLPTQSVREILRRAVITELPTSAPAMVGITQVRGELVGVASLSRILGGTDPDRASQKHLVVVETPRGSLGLLVDAVEGFRQLRDNELADGFWEGEADRGAAIAGITRDLVTILDLDELLTFDRLQGRT